VNETGKSIVLIVSALFPIVNPLGGSPFFLALTQNYTHSERRALSSRVAVNGFFLLIGSYFIGSLILEFFGISIPVVQVAGGLVVISNGWTMLQRRDEEERREVQRNVHSHEILRRAFYPLTLPLTVGPGSISVAITLGANAPRHFSLDIGGIVAPIAASAVIGLTIFLCYGFADRLARVLGATAMSVVMRLSSFLLVCIGVQILWNGVHALVRMK
jgi:multiple antibiotic resistance protein